jgi:deazaflavin-dependent oxidoreductase (nitroreductase family)
MIDTDHLSADHPNTPPRYLEPGWFTRKVANPLMNGLTRMGVSVKGSRQLRVRGRSSGEWRSNPVNLLTLDSGRYLVAPRGTTNWVRNLRVAGAGELRIGRRTEEFTASEMTDDDVKIAILREYLGRWRSEVKVFFEGIGPDATDDELRAIAPGYPVFVITTV